MLSLRLKKLLVATPVSRPSYKTKRSMIQKIYKNLFCTNIHQYVTTFLVDEMA